MFSSIFNKRDNITRDEELCFKKSIIFHFLDPVLYGSYSFSNRNFTKKHKKHKKHKISKIESIILHL